jgi:predicted permease
VVTLGLGIGMNTAIFSAVNAVLLQPLPYDRPETLVSIAARYVSDDVDYTHFAGRDLISMKERVAGLAELAAVTPIRQNLTGSETPEQVRVGWVSTNLFQLLGVTPSFGRGFVDGDPPGTAMLSYELWQRGFGGDDVLGTTVQLDGYPYNIVGIMPRGFQLRHRLLPAQLDIWKVPDTWWQNGDIWGAEGVEYSILRGFGRMAPGSSIEALRESMRQVAADLRQRVPAYAEAGLDFVVEPLHDGVVHEVRGTLLLLFAAVGFVLLIACANVMNLMLVRSQSRSGELALRVALGCSRLRVIQLLLAESFMLAVGGTVLGLGLGRAGSRFLQWVNLGSAGPPDFSSDGTVLAFAAGVCVLCILLFGLVPALGASRGAGNRPLAAVRGGAGIARQRLNRTLVVAQIALSIVLLTGAGLLTASLVALHKIQPGFDYHGLLTFTVSLPGTRYERPLETDAFLQRLEERIETLPGVASVGVIWPMPLTGRSWSSVYMAGRVDEGARAYAGYRVGTPSMFETLGIRPLDGATFGSRDPLEVVVVSKSVAERAWPGQRAVGKTLTADPWGGGFRSFEVIGVVDDVKFGDLRLPAEETLYFDSKGWSWTDWEMNVAVRTEGSPESLIPAIRAELLTLDPEIPIADAQSMDSYVTQLMGTNRLALFLLGCFAGVALVLAGIGLYGVMSYTVNQRQRELGIRLALGSERRDILALVLGHGLVLTVAGVALGLVGAVLLTRFLENLLVETTATDPATFVAVTFLLLTTGLTACYVPARRATRVNVAHVLRPE